MKVFISWSGKASGQVALVLKNFIETLYGINAFVSMKDIGLGANGYEEILKSIRNCDVLIACITRENKEIMSMLPFEMGAMAVQKKDKKETKIIIPFLFEVKLEELTHRKEFLKRGQSFTFPSQKVAQLDQYLRDYFGKCGCCDIKNKTTSEMQRIIKDANKNLNKILNSLQEYQFFISCPMAGFSQGHESMKEKLQNIISNVVVSMEVNCDDEDLRKKLIYRSPGTDDAASTLNFNYIQNSSNYILIYPSVTEKSSVFLETGAAMALDKPITIFSDTKTLPKLIQDRIESKNNVTLINYNSEDDDLQKKLQIHIEKYIKKYFQK